jgi:O-acetyl-ADP-ribose deacetylase (regulator of RNase III)
MYLEQPRLREITLLSLDTTALEVATAVFKDIPFNDTLAKADVIVKARTCTLEKLLATESFDAIAAPGNSFGHMTGGFDGALAAQYPFLDKRVRDYIQAVFCGECNVGQAFEVSADRFGPSIIYAPTMRIPKKLPDNSEAPYLATFAIMQVVRRINLGAQGETMPPEGINTLLLPVMGMGTGLLPITKVARQMQMAIVRALDHSPIDTLGNMGYAIDTVINR